MIKYIVFIIVTDPFIAIKKYFTNVKTRAMIMNRNKDRES